MIFFSRRNSSSIQIHLNIAACQSEGKIFSNGLVCTSTRLCLDNHVGEESIGIDAGIYSVIKCDDKLTASLLVIILLLSVYFSFPRCDIVQRRSYTFYRFFQRL